MAEYPLMKYWKAPDGTVYEVCDGEARKIAGEGGVSEDELTAAVNAALEQAKESGEFDGAPGKDGVSPSVTVSKSGRVTTIKITDAAGTKTATVNDGTDGAAGKDGYTPQKGVDYFDGAPGAAGKDGTSVTVTSVSESTEDGGTNTVTFSDGKKLNIKNGSKGSKGDPGSDATVTEASIKSALGYTPADAKVVDQLSAEKVNLPMDGETPVHGTAGAVAVSDGSGGITWKDENNYELIETITLTEDTASISRSAFPSGEVYMLSAVQVYFKTGDTATAAGHAYISLYAGGAQVITMAVANAVASGAKRYFRVAAERNKKLLDLWNTASAGSPGDQAALQRTPPFVWFPAGGITSLKATCSTAFPTGTVIEIYGVRV